MPDLERYLMKMNLGPEVHVLDVSASDQGRNPLITVVVDTPTGITIDEIADISRKLRKDTGIAQHVGTTDFRMDVTSPGVSAGLRESWQFPRHIGRRLIVYLNPDPGLDDRPVSIEGELMQTTPKGIVIRSTEADEEIAWSRIKKAVVQLNW